MPRSRTQKQVAKRIDLSYHKRLHPLRLLRRVLIVVCTLAAIVWIGISAVRVQGGKLVLIDSIHNPGHVSRAHASFENDCQACHTGDGKGKFTLSVTDTACLKCHDGSLHDANQKIAADHPDISRATLTLAVSDPQHPGGARSAGCVNCHTEHRGELALLGSDNSNCVVCHKNVKAAATQPARVADSVTVVTAFAVGEHPGFGRMLIDQAKHKWVDNTRLKFDHKYHLTEFTKRGVTAGQSCVFCHTTGTEARVALTSDIQSQLPPFTTDKASTAANRTGDSGYMKPITYAEHCSGCHSLDVAGGDLRVSHIELAGAAKQLQSLSDASLAKLAVMSDDDRKKALTEAPAASSSGSRRGRKPTSEASAEAKPITASAWLKKQLKWTKALTDNLDTVKLDDETKTLLTNRAAPDAPPDQTLMSGYLAFGMDNSCGKCHDMSIKKQGTGDAATLSIATLPTGIPATPRHWFTDSRFDHRPHRDISCVDCHAAALNSGLADPMKNTTPAIQTATADVLSPDINSGAVAGKNCIDCHKPAGAPGASATGACISCHVFHDRSLERAPSNVVATATTRPVAKAD